MSARTAFLFPGQGEEQPGMAAAYLENGPVRELLDHASERVGVDLATAIQRDASALTRTELVQPALCAISLGLVASLEALGERPGAVAGHSLGELSAAAAAGCITPRHAVELACLRGRLMGEAARRTPGGMVALRTPHRDEIEALLARGTVELAAHNAPDLWILSGSRDALRELKAQFSVTHLPVGGPWHSRFMAEAARAFRTELRAFSFAPPQRAWFASHTGQQVTEDDDVRELLARQLTEPVQWVQTMQALRLAGIERFVTVGPSRTLRGLCRANLGTDARVWVASGARRVEQGLTP